MAETQNHISSSTANGNTIPKGYKQTEVGVIPEDWIYCKFQDVLTGFSSGMTPYRGNPEYYKGSIPWITSGELNYNIILDTAEKVTQEAVLNTNLKLHPVGTFLMAITGLEAAGTRGSCGITGVIATTNQSCMALFPLEEKLLTGYLYHFYVKNGDELAFKFCQGTKQQSYTGRIAKILPIVLPPTLIEQKAIATALSDVDALISNLDRLITKKKAIKQGAMQQLLTPPHKGGKRLPGFSGDWVEKNLGAFCELTSSKRIFEHDYVSNGVPFYRGKEISLLLENKPISEPYYITEDKYQSLETQFGAPQKNDILITAVGTLGNVYLVPDNKKFYFKDGNLIWLRKSKGIDSLFFSMQIGNHKKKIIDNAIGSSQKALTIVVLKEQIIPVPPTIDEQKAIAQILSDMNIEIKQLQAKKEKYQTLKLGMMQELLTGKTRLIN